MCPHDLPDQDGERKGEHTPYMQFYTSDWTSGTIGFTLEQRGFYFEALKAMWELKGGLVDEIKWLSCALRCDPRTARRLRSFLINKGKLIHRDGLLINCRMDREIAKWKRRHEAKFGRSSGEVQPKLDLIFPETPTKSMPPHPQSSSDPYSDKDRSFEPRVIDGGKTRPAALPRFVSEQALDRVRQIAPGWDRQALLRKFLDWPKSRDAQDMDKAFLGWVAKFVKSGKTA